MHKHLIFFLSCLFLGSALHAQIVLNGRVMDIYDRGPIPFATVALPDTVLQADQNGMFSIRLKLMPDRITVSHIAYRACSTMSPMQCANQVCTIVIYLEPADVVFQAAEVTAQRAGADMPVTFTNIKGAVLQQQNFGEDMPMLLEALPSAVATSDAGNGVGYTGLRIRGADATRVNITINGVPYNDAESQQTYWVNLPDFASSVDDIQVQRGVGTSINGISSFGAAVNIHTNTLSETPFARTQLSTGSFGLQKWMGSFGSGRLNNHWFVEGRVSELHSDGFIDRGFADLQSWFFTGGYKSKRYTSIINAFSGNERTYQAWAGVPAEVLDTNRTYNPYTYEDQTDNYRQTHYQWHNTLLTKNNNAWRLTLNYTTGAGYYEQLESEQYYSDYGAAPFVTGTDTLFTTDLISQKWLDNTFGGAFLQYQHQFNEHATLTTGAATYRYDGDHFGKVIWAQYAEPFGYDHTWYDNNGLKWDGNVFAQFVQERNRFTWMLDLQVRTVNYQFQGYDAFGALVDQQVDLLFFNPKAGITWKQRPGMDAYVFVGHSSKEPNRDDYVESTPLSRPVQEQLYNLEIGERITWSGWQIMLNYYLMYYIDQLVLTGEINDVGAYTRANIPESYRTGVELAWSKTFLRTMQWTANASFSANKILDYTEYVDDWNTGAQVPFIYASTDLAFSPSVIAFSQFQWRCWQHGSVDAGQHQVSLAFTSKYVGDQYADNTGTADRLINAYQVHDVGIRYQFSDRKVKQASLSFLVQNLLNAEYESNAWVYRYILDGAQQQIMGYYPQAGRNWVLMATFAF